MAALALLFGMAPGCNREPEGKYPPSGLKPSSPKRPICRVAVQSTAFVEVVKQASVIWGLVNAPPPESWQKG